MIEFENITPVLMGADMNAYSVAAALYESRGLFSVAVGRGYIGATSMSAFIKSHRVRGFDRDEIALPALRALKEKYRHTTAVLIPCTDWYLSLLDRQRSALSPLYHFHIPTVEHIRTLGNKSGFYKTLDGFGISYPETVSFSFKDDFPRIIRAFPYENTVLKAADGIDYLNHPIKNMRKVWYTWDKEETIRIALGIFSGGYSGELCLQRRLRTDSHSYVLTAFSGPDGKVSRAVMGRVILRECGMTSSGNYCAIVTVPLSDVAKKLISMLNEVHYLGIATFRIMKERDREFVIDMTLRQGRSSDYTRAAGVNLGGLILDAVMGKCCAPDFNYPEIYWRSVSDKRVKELSHDRDVIKNLQEYISSGRAHTPYECEHKSNSGPVRRVYVSLHTLGERRRAEKALNRIQ